MFLEIPQNSPENTCARVSFLMKLQALACNFIKKETLARPATLFKKRLWHRCFPVNFVKFLRTSFYLEDLWWQLLSLTTFRVTNTGIIKYSIRYHHSSFKCIRSRLWTFSKSNINELQKFKNWCLNKKKKANDPNQSKYKNYYFYCYFLSIF